MRKLFPLTKVRSKKSGIILMVVLWMMTLFTILALSLSRGTHVELLLAKYHVGKTVSRYLAMAGLMYAVDIMKKDLADEESSRTDTLYFLARPLNDTRSPEEAFKDVELSEGSFSLIRTDAFGQMTYGLGDEESKININAMTPQNYRVLSSLIILKGFDEQDADIIASSVVDWIDADDAATNGSNGAEEDHYEGLDVAYHCKNHPFDAKEELLMVRGVSKEIFDAVKDDITIFPKIGNLRINFDTAPLIVLQALSRGVYTGTDTSNPDSIAEKIIAARSGSDGAEGTVDDAAVQDGMTSLNAQESLLFNSIGPFRAKRSDLITVISVGTEPRQSIQTQIEAVVSREDFSVVYWSRN